MVSTNDKMSADSATTALELQALINATPGISLLIDGEGVIVCASERAAHYFGIRLGQLIGTNVYGLFDAATSAGRRIAVERARASRAPVVFEDERDGKFFRHSLMPAIAADGVVRRVGVFTEDITDRKEAEIALRASEERFRFLAENTGDVVWETDAQLRFTYINSADERMRGFPREEVLGRSVLELFTPEGQAVVHELSARRRSAPDHAVSNPRTVFQAQQVRKDGSCYWTEVSSTARFDLAGNIVGYNGITHDIDASKRHERELEAANAKLQSQLQEIRALQTQLTEMAVRDTLTGLHNRRYVEETLPRELARAKRDGYPLALILIDLDLFKRINDTYGHPAGDAVLKAVAKVLRQGARESDIVSRYGGEEFLVVLPNMAMHQALARAESWQRALAGAPVQHGAFAITTTLSAGIAAYPDNSADIEALLRLADDALYRAKANGRNRVECVAAM